jgi:hypothetical protein
MVFGHPWWKSVFYHKKCTVVDGIRLAIKTSTSSKLIRGNRRLLAGHTIIFSTTAVNPWQMAGPLKAC